MIATPPFENNVLALPTDGFMAIILSGVWRLSYMKILSALQTLNGTDYAKIMTLLISAAVNNSQNTLPVIMRHYHRFMNARLRDIIGFPSLRVSLLPARRDYIMTCTAEMLFHDVHLPVAKSARLAGKMECGDKPLLSAYRYFAEIDIYAAKAAAERSAPSREHNGLYHYCLLLATFILATSTTAHVTI